MKKPSLSAALKQATRQPEPAANNMVSGDRFARLPIADVALS